MFEMKINKKLLPLKISNFLYAGSIGPYVGFLPTIARQLGYSLTTYGAALTVISIFSMAVSPLVGVIVDKFRVKKIIVYTSLILTAISVFILMYTPKITSETDVELICDSNIILIIHSENVQLNAPNQSVLTNENIDQLITCKLDCQGPKLHDYKISEFNNQYNTSDDWKSVSSIIDPNDNSMIDVEFKLNNAVQNQSSYIFNVLSFQINNIQIPPTICHWHLKTFCHTTCSNDAITDLAKVTTYRGNVLHLYQFWIFFTLLGIITASIITFDTIINSVCLDLLKDKTEEYGKQKLWCSIGWGLFSIFIGWLVDQVSFNAKEKNYSPVYYSFILLILGNVFVSTKIDILESKKTKGKLKNANRLFSKHYVIAFILWATLHRTFHTIITHFLFWYMDDMVSENGGQSQRTWLKTLQGLAQGIQCFGGEIPFYLWSGWIIKQLGHVNCMALTLATMAVRMYLYTVIWNPAWIILIELLNGLSFALGTAAKMSYAKLMSPPDTTNTVIGYLGFFECVGDSLGSMLGGYLFDSYGGVWLFRFFAYGSALACVLNLLSYHFGFIIELKNNNFSAVPTEINTKDAVAIEDQ